MRKIRTAVFASIAALAAAGTAVAATADTRVMKVGLPDGSVARIEYQGEVAPKVIVAPAVRLIPVQWTDPFEAAPFAMFDRIVATMHRQTEMMMQQMQQVHTLQREPNALGMMNLAGFGSLPAGTVSYRFSSTSIGNGTCSRSVQVTSLGAGQQPKVMSKSSGDCGHAAKAPGGEASAAENVGKPLQTT
ncbi:hypothetical protein ATM17_08315 [Sphingopyxis macrogoltabida]|uniref:Uncharacterized protein n=2 Tax=Sphingopyxis macrogoltabida TaxID=33050 RepID=A0AAC9AUX1_SPHMC|nr:hypothetical protein LH19_11535 [Sphingopyxis macrogoltabida]AMU89042.1 hypothetical protein ATM17_08315 [Sphingopyxis macrogoltabida]